METIKSLTHSCVETCTHMHIATKKAPFHVLCNKQVRASRLATGMTDHES